MGEGDERRVTTTKFYYEEDEAGEIVRCVDEDAVEPKWLNMDDIEGIDASQGDRPWFWKGIVKPGAVTMIAGDAGCGKSTLLFDFVRQAGREYLGLAREIYDPLFLLVSEESIETLAEKSRAFDLAWNRSLEVCIAEPGQTPVGTLNLIFNRLAERRANAMNTEELQPALVVIDTLAYFLDAENENDAGAVGRAIKPFLDLKHLPNVGVLLIHHTGKNSGTYRGSSVFKSHVEIMLTLKQGSSPDGRMLEVAKSRCLFPPEEVNYRLVTDGVKMKFVSREAVTDARAEQAAELHTRGMSYEVIGTIMKLSPTQVGNLVRKYKIGETGSTTPSTPL